MQAALLIVLSTLFVMLWSSGWVVSRFAIEGLSAMTLLSARYLILFIVLLLLVSVLRQWRPISLATLLHHLMIGILSHAVYLLAGIGAFEFGVSASLVAFVSALQPMITAALCGLITQEETTPRQWQGLLLGLSAVMLLVSDGYMGGLSAYSLVLPFLAVTCLSIGFLLNKRFELQQLKRRKKQLPVTLILFIHSMGALIVLLPLSATHNLVHFDFTASQWLIVIWLALVVSLGAYALLLILLRHLPSMQVATLGYLVPPATMLQVYIVFGDPISRLDIVGLGIAGAGVYLVMKPSVRGLSAPSVTRVLSVTGVLRKRQQVDIEL